MAPFFVSELAFVAGRIIQGDPWMRAELIFLLLSLLGPFCLCVHGL
jgi:hypothetical protein